jgi:hypothetical protein
VLLRQMQAALREAPELAELAAPLDAAGASLAAGDVPGAARALAAVCGGFE